MSSFRNAQRALTMAGDLTRGQTPAMLGVRDTILRTRMEVVSLLNGTSAAQPVGDLHRGAAQDLDNAVAKLALAEHYADKALNNLLGM